MDLSEEVEDELASVSSILFDTIEINRQNEVVEIQVQISPLTASDEKLSYVSMMLSLSLTSEYPEKPPKIVIKNPRGLSQDDVASLLSQIESNALEMSGDFVIFSLIDFCREFLTERNFPDSSCPICLMPMDSDFCKTSCFHHFHEFCLGRHFALEAQKPAVNPVLCPVCREDISGMNVDKLTCAVEPENPATNSEKALTDWKNTQRKMKKVFDKQAKAGGIIDLDQEAKRCLVITRSSEQQADDQPSTSHVEEDTSATNVEEASKAVKASTQKNNSGNRQRFKRQPKSKYAHHRQAKTRNS